MLEVKNLHAYYGKSHVLHGVDLHVNKGEIVSLLGRNGVGRFSMEWHAVPRPRNGAIQRTSSGKSRLPVGGFQLP